MDLQKLIRDVPDFPKPGIMFKDITPLLGNPGAMAQVINDLAEPYRKAGITKVIGIESRGFIFGAPVALALNAGFVPIRKPGKLPYHSISQDYGLEYGKDKIEIHKDAVGPADRILIVDDVLATGGTAAAAISLIKRLDASVLAAAFVIDLAFLGGAKKLGVPVSAVLTYN